MLGKVACACFGPDVEAAHPPAWVLPSRNHRVIYWAKPGEILHYGERSGEPERRASNLPYGLILIENQIIQEDDFLQKVATMRERVEMGQDIARDVARHWFEQGAFYFEGVAPAEEQLTAALERQRKTAERHIHLAVRSVAQNRAGNPGKPDYEPSDEAWAKKLGRQLPKTFEQLPSLPQEPAANPQETRLPCPECRELIIPGARRCKECGSQLPAGWETGEKGEGQDAKPEMAAASSVARKQR